MDVVAVAGSNARSARAKADALHVEQGYGSYQELLDDPRVQVVHNATPNYLHYEVNAAAIAKGKHVVSDKPLAMTAAEAKSLLRSGPARRDRPCGDLQLPGQPDRPARADRDRPRRHRHAPLRPRPLPAGLADQGHGLFLAPRARQGRRLVRARRHRIALVRPGAARQRPAHHARARGPDDVDPETPETEGEGIARSLPGRRRRGDRGGGHHRRGSRVGARPVRQRRQGRVLRRPGVRRAQERRAARSLRARRRR